MTTIAERCKAHLHPDLADVLDRRTQLGIAKYGQTLDDNHKPNKAKAVHLVQELLDAAQYAEWLGQSRTARVASNMANQVYLHYELTPQEVMEGGKS